MCVYVCVCVLNVCVCVCGLYVCVCVCVYGVCMHREALSLGRGRVLVDVCFVCSRVLSVSALPSLRRNYSRDI